MGALGIDVSITDLGGFVLWSRLPPVHLTQAVDLEPRTLRDLLGAGRPGVGSVRRLSGYKGATQNVAGKTGVKEDMFYD